MSILSFAFTKIDVERKKKATKQINVKSNMNITNVEANEVVKGSSQKAHTISFRYETLYEPAVGHIVLEGDILHLSDEKTATEIEAAWSKNKSLPKDIALLIFNKVLHHCNVEALILSRDISLPTPVQLPKVKADKITPAGASTKK